MGDKFALFYSSKLYIQLRENDGEVETMYQTLKQNLLKNKKNNKSPGTVFGINVLTL